MIKCQSRIIHVDSMNTRYTLIIAEDVEHKGITIAMQNQRQQAIEIDGDMFDAIAECVAELRTLQAMKDPANPNRISLVDA